jgi:hypothetical protein
MARNPSAFARSGFRLWKTECHATVPRVQKGRASEAVAEIHEPIALQERQSVTAPKKNAVVVRLAG